MSSQEKHPHIERPSTEEIMNVLQSKDPMIRQLYLDTHMLILDTLPGIHYSIDCKDGQMGYGAWQYGYNGWGMVALSAHNRWVSLGFMHGADLKILKTCLRDQARVFAT